MAKVAFLFPGQGAQSVGMCKEVVESIPAARKLFDEASTILGYDLYQVCQEGPKEKLDSTVVSQPAIFVASLASLEKLRATEPAVEADCIASAGLSLGEYTALVFARALSFADGVRLVQKRGQAMQEASDATPSGMISVLGLDPDTVGGLCDKARSAGKIEIANLLCPKNIVVSGEAAACDAIEQSALEAGAIKTIRLAVAGAFHTDIMKPADEKLAAALAQCDMKTAKLPVWSNVDAKPHTDPAEAKGLLIRQVLQPVLWEETMRNLLAQGVERFYEIGPGRVLAGLLKRIDRKIECVNV